MVGRGIFQSVKQTGSFSYKSAISSLWISLRHGCAATGKVKFGSGKLFGIDRSGRGYNRSQMSNRKNIPSGSPWEDIVGYSRVVRVGNIIEVSGTTSVENGKTVGINDPYLQTQTILKKIAHFLGEAGVEMRHVVRTRIFVTDISRWEEVGRAHGEFFKDIKPVNTMVEVKALISPELMVEIEATAVIDQ